MNCRIIISLSRGSYGRAIRVHFFVQSYVLISESYHTKPYILRDYGSNTCCYNNDGLFGHNCIGWIRQYKIQSEKHEIQ